MQWKFGTFFACAAIVCRKHLPLNVISPVRTEFSPTRYPVWNAATFHRIILDRHWFEQFGMRLPRLASHSGDTQSNPIRKWEKKRNKKTNTKEINFLNFKIYILKYLQPREAHIKWLHFIISLTLDIVGWWFPEVKSYFTKTGMNELQKSISEITTRYKYDC